MAACPAWSCGGQVARDKAANGCGMRVIMEVSERDLERGVRAIMGVSDRGRETAS